MVAEEEEERLSETDGQETKSSWDGGSDEGPCML